ncbi:hypothetical protein E2C01_060199 [Portunus trituberculatus]|uniref:Uncharacterized protein n=1 Tax=Portunus trituberculatus TaxID=210409 RepID=A0A5B7H823_PORTR|nr:hypothetical protein [Portunus trituberculatus]
MYQWVEESTWGGEEPSMLDPVFTKKPEPPPSIQYLSPMGRSDHSSEKIHAWYSARRTEAKKAKDKTRKKFIKQRNDNNRQQYKDARN